MDSFEEIRVIHDQRKTDTLANTITENNGDVLILESPSDIGVCRNGGRRGTNFGPRALMTSLLKCTLPADHLSSIPKLQRKIVSSMALEEESFSQGQLHSIELIKKSLKNFSGNKIIHLGGGHDHIFPLLSAIEKTQNYHHLKVLNLDAHLDTRTDTFAHSGTPFRQFAEATKREFTLYQLGIHPFSNGASNYTPFTKGKMKILPFLNPLETLKKEITLEKDDLLILSVDCDNLHSSFMEGVSAVNHHGMELDTLHEVFAWYKTIIKEQISVIGIYEFNPVYENLSQKGAKALASVLYHSIFNA